MGKCGVCGKKGLLLETNRCFSCGKEICKKCVGKPSFAVDFQNERIEIYSCSGNCLNVLRKYFENIDILNRVTPKLQRERKLREYVSEKELISKQFNILLKDYFAERALDYLGKKIAYFGQSGELSLLEKGKAFSEIEADFFNKCSSSLANTKEQAQIIFQALGGEKILLEESPFGASGKVILTDKRLLFLKKKALFNSDWIINEEFPLGTIDEAYLEVNKISGITGLYLRLKYDKSVKMPIGLGAGASLSSLVAGDKITDYAVRMNAINNKWLNAINNQLRKHQIEP